MESLSRIGVSRNVYGPCCDSVGKKQGDEEDGLWIGLKMISNLVGGRALQR